MARDEIPEEGRCRAAVAGKYEPDAIGFQSIKSVIVAPVARHLRIVFLILRSCFPQSSIPIVHYLTDKAIPVPSRVLYNGTTVNLQRLRDLKNSLLYSQAQ